MNRCHKHKLTIKQQTDCVNENELNTHTMNECSSEIQPWAGAYILLHISVHKKCIASCGLHSETYLVLGDIQLICYCLGVRRENVC